MGLDMYIIRVKKHPTLSAKLKPSDYNLIESYLDYEVQSKRTNATFEEYSGYKSKPTGDVLAACDFYRTEYSKVTLSKVTGTIFEEVAYWRKSFRIHDWFSAQNDGLGNCEYMVIDKEILRKLLITCAGVTEVRNFVNKNKKDADFMEAILEQKLPDESYDDYYFEDVEDTQEKITGVLEAKDFDDYVYFYYGWW